MLLEPFILWAYLTGLVEGLGRTEELLRILENLTEPSPEECPCEGIWHRHRALQPARARTRKPS